MTDAIICAPMRIEARAIRRGLRASSDPPLVVRTGYGTTRAADRAGELKATSFGQLVVMGVGGRADQRPRARATWLSAPRWAWPPASPLRCWPASCAGPG